MQSTAPREGARQFLDVLLQRLVNKRDLICFLLTESLFASSSIAVAFADRR